MSLTDTIAAIATAPGRGGIAIIRISGSEAFSVARHLTGREPLAGRVTLTEIHQREASDSLVLDRGVMLAFAAPHSYTGENVVELQCHGGSVTPRRILEACLSAGARLARRGEFTERAFLNGQLDYDQAEATLDLINAKTSRAADAAIEGLSGRKRRELQSLYEQALELSTTLEHALDVDEGELPEGFSDGIEVSIANLRENMLKALARAREGHLLREGALVVLAGPPNAGKSSLMNALLEENRAIVSDQPGTTRDSIEEWLDLDGWPIRLVDTAGLRRTKDAVEAEGVRRSEDLVRRADVVVKLQAADMMGDEKADLPGEAILVTSKCDLGKGNGINVSARTGEGLDELRREISRRVAERAAVADTSGDGNIRHFEGLTAAIACLPDRCEDLVVAGNALRNAAEQVGTLIGAVYSSDLLSNLFSRFCVGK